MNHPSPQDPIPSGIRPDILHPEILEPRLSQPRLSQPRLSQPVFQQDPESTLRLLAQLPPPEGLADRVHRRLQLAPQPARFWSQWMPMRRLQFAGAAAVVLALGFSSWTVYENRHHPTPVATHSPVPPTPAAPPASGLSTAGIERRPASLKPIKVPPVPKKKPSAAKSRAAKPTTPQPSN